MIKRDNCTKGMSFLVKMFLKGTNCNFQEIQSGEILLRLHDFVRLNHSRLIPNYSFLV